MSEKPTIVFFTPDCFTQVDDTVLHHLTNDFKVVWFYVYESFQVNNMRYNPVKAREYADKHGIILEIVDLKIHLGDPRNFYFYHGVAERINRYYPDLVYSCDPFRFWTLCYKRINCKCKVLGIHDVSLHSYKHNIKAKCIHFVKTYWLKKFKHIITFSPNQQKLLKYQLDKDSYMVSMSYKDFGISKLKPTVISKGVSLLFFGSINVYKGLDLLVRALEELLQEGVDNLKLTIAGKGASWADCKNLIKTPMLYNLQIRFIENEEIPDLMSSHHFIVLPYRNATQSGPLVAALGYGLPVIAPRYGCFTDVFDDKTAVLYQQGELKGALRRVSKMSEKEYDSLRQSVVVHRENYTEEKIAKNYIKAFKTFLDAEKNK